jgi:prefoldin subunit 5
MCPYCHRIACEKCLYNWFVNLRKKKCGFCRENTKFNEMVSVPFMDAVVNFVEKFFNKKDNVSNTIDKELLEYCPEHKKEMLYYYCLDCGKAYCKTCFVFFGHEKDKHNGHSIIEYEKYKNMSFPLLKKNTDKLDKNIEHLEENIKRCLAYKKVYEHERSVGNKLIYNLQIEFNKQIDGIINIIDEQIKKLKEYIKEYDKYKKEVDDFYGTIKHKNTNSDKSCESLIIKLTKINQQKFFSSKDIDKFIDLSKNIYVNTYQSKIGEFNHENMFLSKGLKMGFSPYEIVIDNKQRNEVQISLLMPKEKTPINHNFQAFIFIKKKGEGIQSYDLDELKEDENCYYLRKKIPWDYFGQSIFKLKGVLYDFYFS